MNALKKWGPWLVLALVITLLTWGLWPASSNQTDLHNAVIIKKESGPVEALEETPVEAKSIKAIAAPAPERLEQIERELTKLDGEMKKREEECEAAAKELFTDNAHIDPDDPFYQNPEKVIERLHDTFSKTMQRQESIEGYRMIRETVDSGSGDPIKAYRRLRDYDICRPSHSLTFIETTFEAYAKHRWSDAIRQELIYVTSVMLQGVMGDQFTTDNLIYALGLMRLMVSYKIIPQDSNEEISRLYARVIEQERTFRVSFSEDGATDENRTLLREDFEFKAELGRDALALLRDLRVRHAPDFDQ
jgi:hypothetical protein